MTCRRVRSLLLLILSVLSSTVSFGPSVPKHNEWKQTTSNVKAIDTQTGPKIQSEAAQEALFATSIGMNDTVILRKYHKMCGQGAESAGVDQYLVFRKTFLRNLMKTLPSEKRIAKKDTQRTVQDDPADVDELVIKQEYTKWLCKHNKTEDSSRYPQFKINFLRQFDHDLKRGNFYTLNEFGDCTTAEAQARKADNKSARNRSDIAINFIRANVNILPEDMEKRAWESKMFTPAVRRDIYRILRNPDNLNVGFLASTHDDLFSTKLLTRQSFGGKVEEFAFVSEADVKRKGQNDTICNDVQMLQAVTLIGSTTSRAIAITQAFENYLSETARSWGDQQAACLSVEFLVSFGKELTTRMDINHRIRSRQLSAEEAKVLVEEPYAGCVDIDALRTFGTVSKAPKKTLKKPKRRRRSKKSAKIVEVPVRTHFDAVEMAGREQDKYMFSSAVRRDIYAILRNPNNVPWGASISVEEQSSVFGAVLLSKKSDAGEWATFAFADRHAYEEMTGLSKSKFVVLSDEEMSEAITHIGMVNPVALAVTEAFEAYLFQLAKEWGDREVVSLSIEFLTAFGRELSPRLNVNNKIRSTKLSKEEMLILATEPFSHCVDPEAMRFFQCKQ